MRTSCGELAESSNPLAAAMTFKTAMDGRNKDAHIALGANDCSGSRLARYAHLGSEHLMSYVDRVAGLRAGNLT